uniref:Uncharacterized protein n=1 Tax=Rhizophora mucronata TaxID=61149 RepID=A0A2P2NP41_RHIMU
MSKFSLSLPSSLAFNGRSNFKSQKHVDWHFTHTK